MIVCCLFVCLFVCLINEFMSDSRARVYRTSAHNLCYTGLVHITCVIQD